MQPYPKDGPTELFGALQLARLLTAVQSVFANGQVASILAVAQAKARGIKTTDRWIRVTGIVASPRPGVQIERSDGSGEYCRQPPQGEEVIEIAVDDPAPVTRKFRELVRDLQEPPVPSDPLWLWKQMVYDAELTLAPTFAVSFYQGLTTEIRMRILEQGDLATYWQEWRKKVDQLSLILALDGATVAAIALIAEVCLAQSGLVEIARATGFASAGAETDPQKVAGMLVRWSYQRGQYEKLVDIARELQEVGEDWKERALDAQEHEEFGAALHQAAFRFYASRFVFDVLEAHLRQVDGDSNQLTQMEKEGTVAEEYLMRCLAALVNYSRDLTGEQFRYYLEIVRKKRADQNAAGAELLVMDLIENSWLFPRKLSDELLH